MCRSFLGVVLLVSSPLTARAEVTTTATEMVVRLQVQPMAAPKPALRYLLLPELEELQPGNPIQNYLRCNLMDRSVVLLDNTAAVRLEKLLAMPLKDLPAKELQDYGGPMLRHADRAARMDKPDWQLLLQIKTGGFGLLLPDVQQMRYLASVLQVRFRAEVALHRFDDAIRTAKTMFALSRHMGEHPTLIGDLVGMAIANVAIVPLEEMLEQPGCPNFYWALTNLPSPLISLDKGMEGERVNIDGEIHDLHDRAPMTADEIKKLIAHFEKLELFGVKPDTGEKTVRAWLDARTKNKDRVAAARRRLVEQGMSEERLLKFPAEQVVLLDDKREYEERRDELMKVTNLPIWQGDELIAKMKPYKEKSLLGGLVPALYKVRGAQGRLEQRIALLRHVEALRLYAAEQGKLPEKLADVSVPLPVDPFTGKPFLYKLEGGTAHLRGTPPRGEEKVPAFNLHYEVTLRK